MSGGAALEVATPRLLLRQFRDADHAAYAAISADAEVMRYIGSGAALSGDDAWRSMAAMLGHWALRGYGMWAICLRADDQLIGRAGFIDPPGWPGFEVGWLLARAHWGNGLAREAVAAVLHQAWGPLDREAAISLIRPGNERSIRLAGSAQRATAAPSCSAARRCGIGIGRRCAEAARRAQRPRKAGVRQAARNSAGRPYGPRGPHSESFSNRMPARGSSAIVPLTSSPLLTIGSCVPAMRR